MIAAILDFDKTQDTDLDETCRIGTSFRVLERGQTHVDDA